MARNEKNEQGKTKNGLQYYIFPKKDFGKKMAAIVVKRGSNHLFWKGKNGEEITFPQGTAHFIEHKLFQQEWGDAFTKFTQNGASANAFTDGDKTVYYFTCRERFVENLKILLDFVQKPYFTEEDTEQEKNIITSEITMYDDDPNWVVYYQILNGMYESHPIQNQIAGTAETVAEVTAETLQKAYETYYTTENMALICAGNVPVRQVRVLAETVQKRETDARVYFPMEKNEILEKYQERKMGLSQPNFQIGFKFPAIPKEDWLKSRIAMGFLLELLAGESSPFFEKAYQKELLDEPLGGAFFCGEGYAFAAFSGTGEHPEETAELLLKELMRLQKNGMDWSDFRRIRKKILGRFLRRLDSPVSLGMGQIEWAMMGATAAEVMECIKTLPVAEAEKLLQNAFSDTTMVLSVVR
ncbi:MAG: insulinase family protein [Anaerotignum sp.]|nr:insulinase family protein [Anaerotignum sp.]